MTENPQGCMCIRPCSQLQSVKIRAASTVCWKVSNFLMVKGGKWEMSVGLITAIQTEKSLTSEYPRETNNQSSASVSHCERVGGLVLSITVSICLFNPPSFPLCTD